MLFNSLQFLLFFVVITTAYYQLPWRGRWVLLLVASAYFYMVFIPKYIFILGVTIFVDYWAGIFLEKTQGKQRRWLLILSLVSNIGFLGYFKYFNFFAENINKILLPIVPHWALPHLDFLFPIGLSFHTFQAMSYTIEVYRGNQKAEKNIGIFALYVLFYPQLVAGPIERPQNVLHQFRQVFPYDFQNIKAGLVRMAWGFFKKVVIADRLGLIVDACYDTPQHHNGLTLLVATLAFTFQIYCDFSAYSDIALGSARCMGFKLMENFDTPYLSASISEFWRRWHISLSTWFRDYLYIPLGGNRVGAWRNSFNLFLVFAVSGLWHGAKWTFIVWGTLHGLYLVLAQVRDRYIVPKLPKIAVNIRMKQLVNTLFTFVLVMLTWVFFRAKGMAYSFIILKKIFTLSLHDALVSPLAQPELWFCVIVVIFMLLKEKYIPQIPTTRNTHFFLWFIGLVSACYFFGIFSNAQFIYFQF